MQRNYFRGFLICLIPTLVALYFTVFGEKKKGIDLAGGTILVFEVDKEKTNERMKNEGGAAGFGQSDEDLKKLAENIKRRVDPVDTKGVIVRPVGDGRIEIILPFSDKSGDDTITENFVQFVKNVVSQAGVLDFRILANVTDDDAGTRAAEELIDRMPPEKLDEFAKAGKAPPAPDGEYPVKAAGDADVMVRYVWVELGKEERESLGLNNKFATEGGGGLHGVLATRRNKVYMHRPQLGDDNASRQNSMVFYSRECKNERMKPEDREAKKVEYFLLTRVSPKDKITVGGDITLTAFADQDPNTGRQQVGFRFNAAGGNLFGEITERNRKTQTQIRNLAVVLDDFIVSAPTLNAVIRESGVIMGRFTSKEVNRLVYILRSGALNAELKPQPVSENTVGPTLGADTIRKGLWAVGLSFAAVMVFMVIYYRFVGVVACIALLINLLMTVGFMVGVNAAFTLAGLAGIVLMLGMAVDANVLIYERMREERERGATLAAAVRNGYDRSLATILDTHVTSILTAIVLFAFGNDNLKGFAVSLTVGLVISLFTALFVTRLIIDYAMLKRVFTTFTPMKLFSRPNFKPMSYRYQLFTFTTILTVLGLGLFLYRGDKVLNVDFTRGTMYTARLVEAFPMSGTEEKPGLLDLLSEKQQQARLKIKDVFDPTTNQTRPDGQPKVSDGLTYTIQYEDGFQTTVKLSNKPAGPGADAEAQIKALKDRASSLPDVSIETLRLSGIDDSLPAGTAKSFTVRTTEQEQRLVEVMLDRLLRDKEGKPLLSMNPLTDISINGSRAVLTFAKPISPEMVRGQLTRDFEAGYLIPDAGAAFDLVEIRSPDGTPERTQEEKDGKYTKLSVDVSKNPQFSELNRAMATAQLAPLAGGVVAASPASLRQSAELETAIKRAQSSFAATPLPDSVQTFDPALAADTRNKALYAILASWLIILGYLWFRFGNWTFGLAAVLCLVHDLCMALGAIAVCHYLHAIPGFNTILGIQDFKIDLAAVAALLTLIGFSVNDTIVVFDRIREVRGKNPALTEQMINDSINQTLSRTVLASLTVFLVVGVLYFFGGNGVHLFAFVMVVGVLVGTYSSIFVAAPLLLLFGEGKVEHKVYTPKKGEPEEPTGEKPTAL
jgi:SecD/SecF fusion protein